MTQAENEPDELHEEIEAFWRESVFRARLNQMPSYFGPTPLEVLRPPAWQWGETAEEADRFVDGVIAGSVTGFAVPAHEYAEEPPPEVGEMGIVLDGTQTPRALLVVVEVTTVPRAGLDATILVDGQVESEVDDVVLQRVKVLHHG